MTKFKYSIEHYGRPGMRWYQHIFAKPKGIKNVKKILVRKKKGDDNDKFTAGLDEKSREENFVKMYRNRDKMSTKAINQMTDRINAEARFREAVYAPQRKREQEAQALRQKKRERNQKLIKLGFAIASEIPADKLIRYPDKGKLFDKLGVKQGMSHDDKIYKEAERIYNIRKGDVDRMRSSFDMIRKVGNRYYNNGGKKK